MRVVSQRAKGGVVTPPLKLQESFGVVTATPLKYEWAKMLQRANCSTTKEELF